MTATHGPAELLDLVRGVAHDFGVEPTADGVVRSIVRLGSVRAVRAAVIAMVDGQQLTTVAQHGLDDDEASLYRSLPLGVAAPGTDAARLGVPVYLSSASDITLRYGAMPLAPAVVAFAAVPMTTADATSGVLCVSFTEATDFTDDVRSAFGSLAGICAASMGIGRRTAVTPPPADDSTPLTVRVALLERDMAALRELLEFLGAIAAQRLR